MIQVAHVLDKSDSTIVPAELTTSRWWSQHDASDEPAVTTFAGLRASAMPLAEYTNSSPFQQDSNFESLGPCTNKTRPVLFKGQTLIVFEAATRRHRVNTAATTLGA